MEYRKKPVVIEAIQYDGTNANEIIEFCNGYATICHPNPFTYVDGSREEHITINTLEGHMKVSAGDFVIKGVSGEFYPCKPDIFEKTYEIVQE